MAKNPMSPDGTMSRRCLLNCAGKLAVGSVALAAAPGALLPVAEAKVTPLPWPYKKLNPEEVGDIAYNQWYTGFCMNAALTGLLKPLQKSVGEPYTSFPIDSFVWGHGGVVGWGTMCGTMLGATCAANLIAGPGPLKIGEQISNEVITYYANTELPIYKPKTAKFDFLPPTSKSDSPLCHVSVGKWMKKTNNGFWSPQRKERCARLTADVAMRTAVLLNTWADGKFKQENPIPAVTYSVTAQHNCDECHGGKVPEVITTNNPPPKK